MSAAVERPTAFSAAKWCEITVESTVSAMLFHHPSASPSATPFIGFGFGFGLS